MQVPELDSFIGICSSGSIHNAIERDVFTVQSCHFRARAGIAEQKIEPEICWSTGFMRGRRNEMLLEHPPQYHVLKLHITVDIGREQDCIPGNGVHAERAVELVPATSHATR